MNERQIETKERFVGRVVGLDDEGAIEVRHIYAVPHEHDGEPCRDAGEVNISLWEHDGEDGPILQLSIEADAGLVLARHLQKAADLVFEEYMDRPDIEREAARWEGVIGA